MTPQDAGTGDAGSIDPPAIACDAGFDFCSGGQVWRCDLSGHDAALIDDCRLRDWIGSELPYYGTCSETRCAGPIAMDGGPVYHEVDQAFVPDTDGGDNQTPSRAVYCCP